MKSTTLLFTFFASCSIAFSQIPNEGFEILNSEGFAKNWHFNSHQVFFSMDSSGNSIADSVVFDKTNYKIQSERKHQGNFALQLSNGYNFTKGESLPAIAKVTSDSLNYGFANDLIPVSNRPQSIGFYYLFEGIEGDKAYAEVKVFDANYNLISESKVQIEESSKVFNYAEISLLYFSFEEPAYISIEFGSSELEVQSHLGTTLIVDDLNITYNTSLDMAHGEDLITFFPNPASASFQIRTKNKYNFLEVEVVDLSGKVNILKVGTSGIVICDTINEGIYTVILRDSGLTFTKKLIVRR